MTRESWINLKTHLNLFSNPESLSSDEHCETLSNHLILGIEKYVPKITYTQKDVDIPWKLLFIQRPFQIENPI